MTASVRTANEDKDWYELGNVEEASAATHPVARQHPDNETFNTLKFTINDTFVLEGIDDFFHHDSAVVMPDMLPLPAGSQSPFAWESKFESEFAELDRCHGDLCPTGGTGEGGGDSPLADERIAGAFILATVFKFIEKNKQHKLVIVGHCDTTGNQNYNQDLSVMRAKMVQCLLEGKGDDWCKIAVDKSHTLDIQRVLQYYARTCVWGCNPGPLDDKYGPQTEAAVRSFQRGYNTTFSASLTVDGKVGKQTWGALFDLYQRELASVLGVSLAELGSLQGELKYVNSGVPSMGCGELFPMEKVGVDNYNSKLNRRFEVLFVRESMVADLPPLKKTDSHDFYQAAMDSCGHIQPVMRGSDPLAELLSSREAAVGDLELIDGNPADELVVTFERPATDGTDYGYVTPFDDYFPGVGGARRPDPDEA